MAGIVAALLVMKVAPVAGAQEKLQRAQPMLDQAFAESAFLQRQPDALKDAESLLRDAVAEDPGNAPAWQAMAWLKLAESWREPIQFNHYSEMAEEFANRAGIQAPQASGPWLARGMACLLDNRVDRAKDCVRTALDLAPGNPQVQFYAVAVFALDPATRPIAQQWVAAARAANAASAQGRRLQDAYDWAAAQRIPLDGNRERTLPPYLGAPEPWPPMEGLSWDAESLPAPH
jgi:tetratricopeptide (TPR) repeat protein